MDVFRKKRKKGERKNPFEASMPLDNPDIKIVEARYNEKPFFIGIGTSEQREKKVGAGVEVSKLAGKGEYEMQKELKWRVYLNPTVLPAGFMPEEKLKDWVAGTVSAVSGSIDVFKADTQFEEAYPTLQRFLEKAEEEADIQDYLVRDAKMTLGKFLKEARKTKKKK